MPCESEKMDKIKEDIALARRLCRELKSSNKEAIAPVYGLHHRFFLNFIKKRLYKSAVYEAEDVSQTFWEKLKNYKVFCDYKGRASLRSYLCSILYNHICEINQCIEQERKKRADSDIKDLGESVDKSFETPEENIIENEKEKFKKELLNEARSQLFDLSRKDAAYIYMCFDEGLEYRAMAIRELGKEADEEEIKKKTDAIRKQFTRPRTGSMARFKIILERIMVEKNLKIEDIL